MNKKVWQGIGLAFLALWIGVIVGHFMPFGAFGFAWVVTAASVFIAGLFMACCYFETEDDRRRKTRNW